MLLMYTCIVFKVYACAASIKYKYYVYTYIPTGISTILITIKLDKSVLKWVLEIKLDQISEVTYCLLTKHY